MTPASVAEVLNPMNDGFPPDLFVRFGDSDRRVVTGDSPPKITQMGNRSTGFADLTQSVSENQPRYQSNGINGLGCMDYITSPSLERMISFNTVTAQSANFYLLFAWRYTGTLAGTDGSILTIGFRNDGSYQYIMTIDTTTAKIYSRPWQSGPGSVGDFYSTSALTQNTAYIIEVVYDNANTLHELFIDGTSEGSSSTMLPDNHDRINLTTNHPSVLTAPNAEYEGMILMSDVPSQAARNRWRRYLANATNIGIAA